MPRRQVTESRSLDAEPSIRVGGRLGTTDFQTHADQRPTGCGIGDTTREDARTSGCRRRRLGALPHEAERALGVAGLQCEPFATEALGEA